MTRQTEKNGICNRNRAFRRSVLIEDLMIGVIVVRFAGTQYSLDDLDLQRLAAFVTVELLNQHDEGIDAVAPYFIVDSP